jgi:hypothetical protein
MPTQYVIRFIGKISWEGQTNGLPPEIYAYIIYEGDEKKDIDNIIETQSAAFIRYQAMAVQKDQGRLIDLRLTPAERMLVPFRWIVSLSADIRRMTGELSAPDETGIERLSDGSEPKKQ